MSKNIIILQHIDIETPGYILDLMNEDNFNLKYNRVFQYQYVGE